MDDVATEANTSRPGSPVSPLPDAPAARPPLYRFNWDPSLRRAGPSSVSEATEGRRDLYGSPKSDYFPFTNVSSLALSFPHDWSSSRHGFNAISTVLNNPHKRAAPPKAHSSLPAVPPAELPRVKRRDFEPYLASIADEWERFERSARIGREGAAQIDTAFPSVPEPPPTAALSAGPFTVDLPRTPRTPQLPPGKPLPSLDVVPSVYFDSSFDLGDPRIFALVTEALEGEDGDALDPAAIAHSLPLLEKLSHYADVVEQHLVREISLRSSSFFSALTNLQELQVESRLCLDRVTKLREMLKEVDERTAKRGLEMVRLESRLANMDKVSEGVKVVKEVSDLVGVAGGLVRAGEWGEALGIIEELDASWAAAPSPPEKDMDTQLSNGHALVEETHRPIPLSSLQAFASLPAHLRELTLEIATSLTTDLVSVLSSDLHARTESSQGTDRANESLRDRLRPLLQGLVRTHGVKAALGSWRDLVMVEVRGAVKRHLPSSSDVDDDDGTPKKTLTERSASLAKELREMSHDDFLTLLRAIYASLLRCVHGVQTQMQVITALLESTSQIPSTFEADLSDALASACELANARASKVISVRAEQHTQLPLPAFHALFEVTWQFVVACEVLCRKMIVGLRGAVVSQAKGFLATFHAARITSSAKLVEDEQWAQVDITPDIQRTVELLVDAAMRDPEAIVLPKAEIAFESESTTGNGVVQQPLSPPSTPPQASSPPSFPSAPPNKAAANAKQLLIEEHPYFVVSATSQVLVVLLSDYVKLIVNLPLLTTDAVGRVIEFLKAFNSRTCQVVLGAGAMRSAGLKNITAKHLALASQSLSIAIALIPYVRETFRRHLNATQAVMLVEFDKLRRDYQEHQNEIHAKLVVIMGDRLTVHCRSLQEIKWDVPPTKTPNGYMELLVKETVTLHKVLSKYLATPAVELVMTQVLAAINHRLSEEYGKVELGSQEAKDRLLRDARYLHEKMSGLKHVGAPGGMLETVVQEKAVPGGTPVPVKKSRLSTKMAAAIAGAGAGSGTAGKENGKSEGPDKAPAPPPAPEIEEKAQEVRDEAPKGDDKAVGEEQAKPGTDEARIENRPPSPPPLPVKGFRMDEPGDTVAGEGLGGPGEEQEAAVVEQMQLAAE
ncbi:Vps54-like protein-domain-containing protein [Gautieria morchelliformis]|nr:Vps54-like protein-domain-containing protein [Gautieria morchelliformis]